MRIAICHFSLLLLIQMCKVQQMNRTTKILDDKDHPMVMLCCVYCFSLEGFVYVIQWKYPFIVPAVQRLYSYCFTKDEIYFFIFWWVQVTIFKRPSVYIHPLFTISSWIEDVSAPYQRKKERKFKIIEHSSWIFLLLLKKILFGIENNSQKSVDVCVCVCVRSYRILK